MRKALALGAFLAAAGSVAASTNVIDWNREGGLPGAALAASEWTAVARGGSEFRCARLQATGAPDDLTYTLWQRWLDGGERPLGAPVRLAGEGLVVGAAGGGPVPICLGRFFPGEPLEVALVSEDRRTRVFGTLIPFPLEARSDAGGCRISLRLVDTEGTTFFARVEGFIPGERLESESRSGKDRRPETAAANDEGALLVYLRPRAGGKKGGTAGFTVASARCSVSLDYEWGRAMRRR